MAKCSKLGYWTTLCPICPPFLSIENLFMQPNDSEHVLLDIIVALFTFIFYYITTAYIINILSDRILSRENVKLFPFTLVYGNHIHQRNNTTVWCYFDLSVSNADFSFAVWFYCLLEHSWTRWVSVVTTVYDDIDASIQEGTENSNQHFIVIAVTSRIWMIRKWRSARMQTPENYHLVANWTGNCFILQVRAF